jgi:hypothetical protein
MNFVRWLGVLPVAGVALIVPLFMTWFAVDILYLVVGPVAFLLFVLLAAVVTIVGHAASGYASVWWGAGVAPFARRQVAAVLATLYAIFTVVGLVIAWRRPAVDTGTVSISYLVATPVGIWWWWLVLSALAGIVSAGFTALFTPETRV